MLTRIFGLHGSGKTEKIYEYLEKCIAEKKQSFLIVPEQNALAAERELIKRLGNPANMYVEVINFKRLCNRVFREAGGVAAKVPDKITKQLAMSRALSQISGSLREYSGLAKYPDFALKMLSAAEQMQMNRITPEKIEKLLPELEKDCSESLVNKLCDISISYSAYRAYIENKLDFPGDLLDKLYETLCGFDFFKGKTVFFDSFYGYTAQELAIIEKIISSADDVYMTFICKSPSQKSREFDRGISAAAACGSFAQDSGVKSKDIYLEDNRRHSSPALAEIAENFSLSALSTGTAFGNSDGIQITDCENIYEEAECAVKIASELIRGGASPREIAICAASTDEYAGILDAEFEKAGIPFSFDSGENLSTAPTAALISSAFEVCFSWSLQSITEYIKTGLSGLDDRSADELELYMRTWNISGKKYFCETWYMNPDGFSASEPDVRRLEKINESKELILSCLLPFCGSVQNAKNADTIAEAIYTLTKDIARTKGESVFDDQNGGKDLDLLCRFLDSVHETLGDEQIEAEEFAELFRSCIKNVKSGKLPELIDQVRFSEVSLMRPDGVKYAVILGANDRVFPSAPDRSDFFKDSERIKLKHYGITLAPADEEKTYDELFLAYTALCAASDKAYVLFRRNDLDGNAMYQSVIISILEKMFGSGVRKSYSDDVLGNALSDEVLFEYYMTLPASEEKATLRKYFCENESGRRRIALAEKDDEAHIPLLPDTCSAVFGENMTSSYSKIEKYRECPFKYFCTYTLRLSPEPTAVLGAPEIGNTVHKILEELIPEFVRMLDGKDELSDSTVKKMVSEKLSEMLGRFTQQNSDAVTKRFQYAFARLDASLNSLCLETVSELKASRFVPADFELKLSYNSDVPPLTAELADGRKLALIGAIDRVDVYRNERTGENWVRITDYKTGAKEFKVEDVREGFNLQMLLYLYALTAKETKKYGKLKPAGVIYRIVSPPSKTEDSFGKASSPAYAEEESVGTVSGIVVCDDDVLDAMEPGLGKKGRYIPVSKTSKGDIKGAVSPDELASLLEDAVKKAAELASGISCGNKAAAPYINSGRNACDYCDYKNICRENAAGGSSLNKK